MLQTLFIIPHAWLDGPVFWGWLGIGLVWLGVLYVRKGLAEATGFLPLYLVAAALIRFVLPTLEIDGVNPQDPLGGFVKSGLAIRGYGVCLLAGIMAGIALTIHRAKKVGIDADTMLRLAVWMIVAGVLGARLFYIIQKHDEFFTGKSFSQTIVNLFDATKGGLVVYGSLIGGMIAAAVFFRITRLPLWRTADLIAPGMVLGLAIGRIGCLLNGCCFGGICEVDGLPRVHFPAGSPPYMQQLVQGELMGMKTSEILPEEALDPILTREVTAVSDASLAEQLGIRVGDQISVLPLDDLRLRFIKSARYSPAPDSAVPEIRILDSNRGLVSMDATRLPARSLGVHPTQIYSALDAFLLTLVLWFFWYLRKADGQVFALMLILHGVSRFLLELVRIDEQGIWGTALTISQWMSIGWIVLGIVIWGYVSLNQAESSSAPVVEHFENLGERQNR